MVKSLAAACVAAYLLLILTACSQADTASATENPHTLRIAAAANLSDVLPHIIDRYQTEKHLSGLAIEVTYASSGKLYAQIQAGAPYDVFLSANQAFPTKLADKNIHDQTDNNQQSTKPFTYARGQLALYSVTQPLSHLTATSLIDVLTSDSSTKDSSTKDSKIAIANPDLAPYGASAKTYLQSQDLYDKLNVQKRLIQAENIGQAFQYAHTGSVDYGFVAQSQLIATKAKPEQFMTLPPTSYPAILQDGIVINDTIHARAFSNYLRSQAGQQHFLQAGYLTI